MKIKFWCEECGNEVTQFDAVVEWRYETQTYEQVAFGDRAWCDFCECDHYFKEGTADQHQQFLDEMEISEILLQLQQSGVVVEDA